MNTKSIVNKGIVLLGGFLLMSSFAALPVMADWALVSKTGQTTSYATGDDGDLEMGVAWPNPRFTINGDGTVTDNLTELIWMRNADCFGHYRTWSQALSDCNNLNTGECGLTDGSSPGDWRLPNRNEFLSLLHLGYNTPALPNTVGTGKWSQGNPFNNVQPTFEYWTSTSKVGHSSVWVVGLDYAVSGSTSPSNDDMASWCVRGITGGPAPVPKTGQTTSYATGDDGALEMGVAWPNPRFTINGNGTVTDKLTGLIWLRRFDCFPNSWSQALLNCNNLNTGECGLTDGSYPGDWRLPNRKEWLSLTHLGFENFALPNTAGTGKWSQGNPFNNVDPHHWSSTTVFTISPIVPGIKILQTVSLDTY
jgi:hypothetical protein